MLRATRDDAAVQTATSPRCAAAAEGTDNVLYPMHDALRGQGHRRRGLQRAARGLGRLRPARRFVSVEPGVGRPVSRAARAARARLWPPLVKALRRRARGRCAATCTPTPSCPGGGAHHPGPRPAPGRGRAPSRTVLPSGTGLMCDVGDGGADGGRCAPTSTPCRSSTRKDVPYASHRRRGSATPAGTTCTPPSCSAPALVLADLAQQGQLPGRVRLIFQPAEESARSGARAVIDGGGVDGRRAHLRPALRPAHHGRPGRAALRADHRLGRPALRAADGRGGHTARPHLTEDLVHALGEVVTGLPGALSRRVDPRAARQRGLGPGRAGRAANAIPEIGELEGTLRCLDPAAWAGAPELVEELVRALAAPYGVQVEVTYTRNVPPVRQRGRQRRHPGGGGRGDRRPRGAWSTTEQSLGGEDFAWYLADGIPGALARLGVRNPGQAEAE